MRTQEKFLSNLFGEIDPHNTRGELVSYGNKPATFLFTKALSPLWVMWYLKFPIVDYIQVIPSFELRLCSFQGGPCE
jgi:hypothetical protein